MVVWGISCASICPEFGSFARLARAHAVQNGTAMITVGVIRNAARICRSISAKTIIGRRASGRFAASGLGKRQRGSGSKAR